MNLKAVMTCCAVLAVTTGALAADDAKALVKKANSLFADGKYEEAASLYQRSSGEGEKAGIADFNLGGALYRTKSYYKAVESFNKSIASGNDAQGRVVELIGIQMTAQGYTGRPK